MKDHNPMTYLEFRANVDGTAASRLATLRECCGAYARFLAEAEAKLAAALARAEKAEGQRDALAAAMRRCLDGQCTPGYAACRDALAKL